MRALRLAIALAGMSLVAALPARAHRTSDAFLAIDVRGSELSGSWSIALRDLDLAEDLDADRDRSLTWGELRGAHDRVAADLLRQLAIGGGGAACALRIDDLAVEDRIEGRFAHFALSGLCPEPPSTLSVDYRFLFDADPSHRGILVLNAGGATRTAVFSPERSAQQFALGDEPHAQPMLDFVREGVHHIWIGADHVLFLVSLLLPCVLVPSRREWRGIDRFAPALRRVLGVITAFTAAHSITLSLAALDVVRLPSRFTESAIALSVLFAALANLWPVAAPSRAMAFGFGLVHGFGFASVLGELGLPAQARLPALLSFNVGVELGQLAIAALAVPIAYALRNTPNYRLVIVPAGSLAVAGVACVWLVQRIGGG